MQKQESKLASRSNDKKANKPGNPGAVDKMKGNGNDTAKSLFSESEEIW